MTLIISPWVKPICVIFNVFGYCEKQTSQLNQRCSKKITIQSWSLCDVYIVFTKSSNNWEPVIYFFNLPETGKIRIANIEFMRSVKCRGDYFRRLSLLSPKNGTKITRLKWHTKWKKKLGSQKKINLAFSFSVICIYSTFPDMIFLVFSFLGQNIPSNLLVQTCVQTCFKKRHAKRKCTKKQNWQKI